MTMSTISLLIGLEETVEVEVAVAVAVGGVEDLITGMAIVVKGITMTSRWRLARKRVLQKRRGRGMMIWLCLG